MFDYRKGYKLSTYATINKIVRVSRNLLQKNGRESTDEEIAAEFGLPEYVTLADFIEDHDAKAPAEAASFTLLKEEIGKVLDTLTERERVVLMLCFGF